MHISFLFYLILSQFTFGNPVEDSSISSLRGNEVHSGVVGKKTLKKSKLKKSVLKTKNNHRAEQGKKLRTDQAKNQRSDKTSKRPSNDRTLTSQTDEKKADVELTPNDYMQINAAEDLSKPELSLDSDSDSGLTLEELFIRGDITISEWFDSAAEGLDLLLIGKKVTNRKNKSTIKVENATFSSEGKEVTNSSSIQANLHLPNVEDYWQLKFTSYDEREERRGISKSYLRQEPREENYGTTIGLFRKIGSVRTAYQPRIEIGSSLKISQSLSFEASGKVDRFTTNPKIEFYASPVKGAGIFTSLNFNTPLTDIFSFTLINDADYGEKLHLYSVNNGFAIGQNLTDKASLAYSLIFNSQNQPNYHLDGYFFSISWNHVLYRNILSYQFTPHLDFTRSYGFRAAAGAFLLIDLLF